MILNLKPRFDPCAGHSCDRCPICLSGRCCGRDARRIAAPTTPAHAAIQKATGQKP